MHFLKGQQGGEQSIDQLRQTAHSYVHNQNILFDQREAEIRQEVEQQYQRGLEQRREEQWTHYQTSFEQVRSQFSGLGTVSELHETLASIERQVYWSLFGEQAREVELSAERQHSLDQKRLDMARSREAQIPHDVRSVTQTISQEIDNNPSKASEVMTWDEHVAYFNAKWKEEGFSISEPYEMVVGNPPIKITVPGGQVAHSVNVAPRRGLSETSDLTREGLIREAQLAQLITSNPELMGTILLSDKHYGEAQSFMEGLRDIWKTHPPDTARDSVLMLCRSTLDFHHDFEFLVNGLALEKNTVTVSKSLIEKPSKRVSVFDELELDSATKPISELKKEKTFDF